MTAERDEGWLGDGPALIGAGRQREPMAAETDTDTVDLVFTTEQLSLIDRAAARGCSVDEFIRAEALAEARRMACSTAVPVK